MKNFLSLLKLSTVPLTVMLFSTLSSGTIWEEIPVTKNRNIHLSWTNPDATDSTMVVTWMEKHGNLTEVHYWKASDPIAQEKVAYATAKKSEYLKKNQLDSERWVHSAELLQLDPNTTYKYYVGWEIGAESSWSSEYEFTTAPPKVPTLDEHFKFRFIVGGDTHRIKESRRNQLGKHIIADKPGFLFFSGDEIESVTPDGYPGDRWQKWFNAPDTTKVINKSVSKKHWKRLLRKVPFMTSDSNHVDSHDSFFDLFTYPAPFGTRRLSYKPNHPETEIDCVYSTSDPLEGKRGNSGWYSFNYGNAHFIVLQINWSKWGNKSLFCTHQVPNDGEQYTWLEGDLKNADADPNIKWKFAIWHAPAYSSDVSSIRRNKKIQDTVCRLLTKYNVDMVFNGHQHRYERSKMIFNNDSTNNTNGDGGTIEQENYNSYDGMKNGVVYMVSGGFSKSKVPETPADPVSTGNDYAATYSESVNPPTEKIVSRELFKAFHYCVIDIDNQTGTLTLTMKGYKDKDEKIFGVIDTFTIKKRPILKQLRVISETVDIPANQSERRVSIDNGKGVYTDQAFVLVSTSNNEDQWSDDCDVFQASAKFSDDGRELILKRGGTSNANTNISYHIVESHYIKVQHGSSKLQKGTPNIRPNISWAPKDKSIVLISSRSNTNRGNHDETSISGSLTSVSLDELILTLNRGSSDSADVDVEWSIVTFRSDVNIQSDSLDLKNGTLQTIGLKNTVDPSRSWLYFTTTAQGGKASMENQQVRGRILNQNQIIFERKGKSPTLYSHINWFIVEFPDGFSAAVEHGSSAPISAATKIISAPLSDPITSLGKYFIYHTTQSNGAGSAFARSAWINRIVQTSDKIQFQRWTGGQKGVIDWQVVRFPE